MDKRQVMQQLEKMVREEIEKQKQAIEETRQAAIEAPGRMESRYDTTKVEMSWLADGLNRRLGEMQDMLYAVTALGAGQCQVVCHGALVSCLRGSKKFHYLIVPGGSGRYVRTAEGEVICVSPVAPICQAIMGLGVGEKAMFGKEQVEIVAVI